MLRVDKLSKTYCSKRSEVHAVDEVSFIIPANDIMALIGESGSGKSTIAELIVELQQATGGEMFWEDKKLSKHHRQQIQYIFQNPDRSLNPLWTVEQLLMEPLRIKKVPKDEARKIVQRNLELVYLPDRLLSSTTRECSGGQKQRIAIARTLALQPKLLIADEITASLDPRTEENMIELLKEIKRETKFSILYITHRIQTIKDFASKILVLRKGQVVEQGAAKQVLSAPQTEYTRQLIQACDYRNFQKGV